VRNKDRATSRKHNVAVPQKTQSPTTGMIAIFSRDKRDPLCPPGVTITTTTATTKIVTITTFVVRMMMMMMMMMMTLTITIR